MISLRAACSFFAVVPLLAAAEPAHSPSQLTLSALSSALGQITLDPAAAYRVRELQLTRGDIKIYLTEGVLSFVSLIDERRVAAVFTTQGVEAGDAEILVLPPQRGERASLAAFTKTPNLNEHFTSAVFFFSDDTAKELLDEIARRDLRKASEVSAELAPIFEPVLRQVSASIEIRLAESLFDAHPSGQGFFYAAVAGRNLGAFDVLYEPGDFEPVSVGRAAMTDGKQQFQLWASFRPRRAPPYVAPSPRVSDYQIDTTIRTDLSMSVAARFKVTARESDGRVISLNLSDRLKIGFATVDGQPVEMLQRASAELNRARMGEQFLLITAKPLIAGTRHDVELRYEGTVVRQTSDGSYFVDDRNIWFPFSDPTLTTFDLTFRCPAQLHLVSTGELVSEQVMGEERVVHRRTLVPEAMAGFNLGDYKVEVDEQGPYRVECYANRSTLNEMADIPNQTEKILEYYTHRWTRLPFHSVDVSPVPGYFGQGFPGLIYLSNVSYMRQEDRPAPLRNPRLDAFFSGLLLPHEVAHQWWGNIVVTANYRASWISEAMASDSALDYIEQSRGGAGVAAVLEQYRQDLLAEQNGTRVESAGAVDLGLRLMNTAGTRAWHVITYEKGAWILRMLRQRLGADGFHQMQLRLLQEFATKALTNADLQRVAQALMPADAPDRTLGLFFDTWVYGTGIPRLALTRTREGFNLSDSGVEEDFTADIPLACGSGSGKRQIHWVRGSSGITTCRYRPGTRVSYRPTTSFCI
ncbi:MAG: hypothetical protein JO091_02305, partial [Acidobacteriaceae bacterium]|nr:hypothetical protein [Acidobacteriaceae bacterium]